MTTFDDEEEVVSLTANLLGNCIESLEFLLLSEANKVV
jgi:hypothetical protein